MALHLWIPAKNRLRKLCGLVGTDFPPYVQEASGKFTGLTLDLIEMMNAFQSKYRFEFVPTSSMRRYQDFADGMYDAILFESVDWGWKDVPVDVSRVYAEDCEVFIARTLPNRTQAYFNDLKGKSLRVYLGYHYPFAGYNADPAYLLKAFNARTTISHEANIHSVIAGRANIAVVTQSYLRKYLRDHPAQIPLLLVSDRIAQTYHHTVLVRKHIEPSVDEINTLLDQMDQAGYISILLGKYGMSKTLACPPKESTGETCGTTSPAPIGDGRIVKIGGYHFPPYVEEAFGKFTGLTLDLVALLNAFQSKYHFVFVPTTSVTRYKDFDDRAFDVVFFERKEWGWQDRPMEPSRAFLKDSEVYVTRTAPDKTQQYFDTLKGKTLLGYLGYHYPLAGFETDPGVLSQRFHMRVTASHQDNIHAVLAGRADIAIVTKSYAVRFLRDHPALIPRLLISDKVEQEYRHTVLVRTGSIPTPQEIMSILAALDKAGYSSLLWGKYGVTAIPERP